MSKEVDIKKDWTELQKYWSEAYFKQVLNGLLKEAKGNLELTKEDSKIVDTIMADETIKKHADYYKISLPKEVREYLDIRMKEITIETPAKILSLIIESLVTVYGAYRDDLHPTTNEFNYKEVEKQVYEKISKASKIEKEIKFLIKLDQLRKDENLLSLRKKYDLVRSEYRSIPSFYGKIMKTMIDSIEWSDK